MGTNKEVLEKLPNDRVRKTLLEVIENNIPTKTYTIQIEEGSAKGDNYIGIVHKVKVTFRDEKNPDSSEPKILGLFIKVPPTNLVRRQQFFARPCFLRESLIYDEYLPLLAEFQRSKGIVPEENGFKEYAKCYKNLTDDLEEAVFMEDLSLKGYTMHDRLASPTGEMVKIVMKALGKLHALSFALKDQWPEKFAKFREMEEIFVGKRDDELFTNYINSLINVATSALAEEGDEVYLEKVKSYVADKTLFKHMEDLVNGSLAEPYAVVSHGDCWNNNMLFKFENGKPTDIKLIDWQIARFSSPVCDLMYYIFCCTTKPMRDKHYKDILNAYYTELSTFLKRLGSDPAVLFPRSALDEQLHKFGAFGMIMGLMTIPAFSTTGDDIPDLDELSARMEAGDEEFTKQAFEANLPASRPRIRDTLLDLIKLDYL